MTKTRRRIGRRSWGSVALLLVGLLTVAAALYLVVRAAPNIDALLGL